MTKNSSTKSNDFQPQLLENRYTGEVTVDIRMLIDKILASFSSEFLMCRELIQNADDAEATWFYFDIICSAPNGVTKADQSWRHRTKQLVGGIGNAFQNLTHKAHVHASIEMVQKNDLSLSEKDFHNSYITEIHASNNGHPFNETDWKRVVSIAEGNTNVDAIGQFGVGFFSVFSICEEPIIVSENEYMLFSWENDNLLTFRRQLPDGQEHQSTTIILVIQKKYILLTNVPSTSNSTETLVQSESNRNAHDVIPTLKLIKLKKYFTKVLSFTKHINNLVIRINGSIVFQITKKKKLIPISQSKFEFDIQHSIHNLFCFQSFLHNKQTFTIANGPSLTLNHICVKASVSIDNNFQKHVRHILKKNLPSTISIELLFASNSIIDEQYHSSANNDVNRSILNSLIPLKSEDNQMIPAGNIFIGLETQQLTGIGMHVCSHLIPTVEREKLDFQNPYIKTWNEELLLSVGQIVRFLYDQTMNKISSNTTEQEILLSMSPFSYQPTVPQNEIGDAIQSGFINKTADLLVPIRHSPSDSRIFLVSSREAYLTQSKDIQTFLTLPLVPFELSKTNFFINIRQRRFIGIVNNKIVEKTIAKTILLFDELINLIRWLCNNKESIKHILQLIRYRETIDSPVITLKNIQHYITKLMIPSNLPLPSTVLPSNVIIHFSLKELNQQLSLSEYNFKDLIKYYLLGNQREFLENADTSSCILSLISQNLNLFNDAEWNSIKMTLSTTKCIWTNHGMKMSDQSYIPSSILSSSTLPIIKFNLIDNNDQSIDCLKNTVSVEFLKRIGCHTFDLQSFLTARSLQSNGNMKKLIEQLIKERKKMSDSDLDSLKKSKWLQGETNADRATVQQYAPHRLYFPSVAIELGWPSLCIVDYPDIEPNSPEYNFLKDLGVREVPDLQLLIDHIVEEHNKKTSQEKEEENYELPPSFCFLIKHFILHYRKSWNENFKQTEFIPSFYLPNIINDKNNTDYRTNRIILSQPNQVFIDDNPLCSIVLSQVIELFKQYSLEVSLLGVKQSPDIQVAFDLMLKRKDEFLSTMKSTSRIFRYLYKIYQRNKVFNENISKVNFIPLQDYYSKEINLKKPTEVFIHRENSQVTGINMNRNGLLDYVDFGVEGNKFLENIGVKEQPSTIFLAHLLLDRQAIYFNENNNDHLDLSDKCNIYADCLKRLAAGVSELQGETIKRRLTNEPWCLAYQYIDDKDGNEGRLFKIVKPAEVYINDHPICAKKFQPFCAPFGEKLAELYEQFGSKYLSERVKKTTIVGDKTPETNQTKELCATIMHRLKILFVDNKGKNLPNVNIDHVKRLRKLSVYETDTLKYQLRFQRQTITLDSNESNSCELIDDNGQMILYLRKGAEKIIYYDVAKALARFVFTIPTADISLISNKLLLSEMELKQRGIPVDLLLNANESETETTDKKLDSSTDVPFVDNSNESLAPKKTQELPSNSSQNDKRTSNSNKLPDEVFNGPTNAPNNTQQPTLVDKLVKRTFRHTPMPDFGVQHRFDDDYRIKDMIKDCQSYNNETFTTNENIEQHIEFCCTTMPAADMIRHEKLFYSIPLYIERNVNVTEIMLDRANQFAWLIFNLTKNVFNISLTFLHLFRDINGPIIAFNQNGALFFNLRYYEQVFAKKLDTFLQNPIKSNDIVPHIVNYYYMITCHELAHNIAKGHGNEFVAILRTLAVKYMSERAALIQHFSFDDALKH